MFVSHGTELKFLFSLNPSQFNNKDNKDSIYGNLYKKYKYDENNKLIKVSKTESLFDVERVNVYKPYKKGNKSGTESISKRIGSRSLKKLKTGSNPYLKLIETFNNNPSLKLKPADFVYLKDLGVYPPNRLVILRRFREGVMVPTNLNDWPKDTPPSQRRPISTVVGWVKDGDEKLFNLSFNEKWTVETKMLHEILGEILSNEFGFDAGKSIPIPGWSQGLLFGFLKAMGLTDFGTNEIPFGNPNVLQEGATRDSESFGLVSNLDISLETSYEQKYINGIDPGIAMNDIIDNLLRMGTSNVKYVLSIANDKKGVIKSLLAATNNGTVDTWIEFIQVLVDAFVTAIITIIKDVKEQIGTQELTTETSTPTTASGALDKTVGDSAVKLKNFSKGLKDISGNILGSILASTLNKYRWPLRGSVSVMTGLPSTPWHITVGNPYMPILSMNNIVVNNVNIDFGNELAFNDAPVNMDVKIDCVLGRNMGAQEIMTYFNNGYKRYYILKPTNVGVDDVDIDVNKQDVNKQNDPNSNKVDYYSKNIGSSVAQGFVKKNPLNK